MSDSRDFEVRSGTRVTGREIREHPGLLPIYSCFRTEREIKGFVDEQFFVKEKGGIVEASPIVTINANGASVGKVYVRRDQCGITDDVIVVEVKNLEIDLDYLAIALRAAVDRGGYLYEAKLFAKRVRELEVELPTGSGEVSLERQREIAQAVKRFDALRTRLADLGARSSAVRAV